MAAAEQAAAREAARAAAEAKAVRAAAEARAKRLASVKGPRRAASTARLPSIYDTTNKPNPYGGGPRGSSAPHPKSKPTSKPGQAASANPSRERVAVNEAMVFK